MARSGRRARCAAWVQRIWCVIVLLFIAAPSIIVLGASLTAGNFLRFPPDGLSLRWYSEVLSSDQWRRAAMTSVEVLAVVVPLCLFLAILSGYAISRGRFRGRGAANVAILAPMMVPYVVLGLALLFFMADIGLLGSRLGVILGQTVVALPFVARLVISGMQDADPHLEDAAAILGAGVIRRLFGIVLPLAGPGIFAGAVLGSAIALGETAITILVSGPTSATLPVVIFAGTEYTNDASVAAVSSLLLGAAGLLLVLLQRVGGIGRL